MFKFLLIAAALVACAAAVESDYHAQIRSLSQEVRADGFHYSFDTTNGIAAEATGDVHGNIHGSYSYISPEGQPIHNSYIANEYGYQPQSELSKVRVSQLG